MRSNPSSKKGLRFRCQSYEYPHGNQQIPTQGIFEDDFPFSKVGYVRGMSICPEMEEVVQVGNQLSPFVIQINADRTFISCTSYYCSEWGLYSWLVQTRSHGSFFFLPIASTAGFGLLGHVSHDSQLLLTLDALLFKLDTQLG